MPKLTPMNSGVLINTIVKHRTCDGCLFDEKTGCNREEFGISLGQCPMILSEGDYTELYVFKKLNVKR